MTNWLKNNVWLLLLGIFSIWLYGFHVDYTALSSWDEAWYASIAREITLTNDWVTLHFNSIPFYDHPPMGFWIMALFYKLFGINELITRLPSILAGIGSSLVMYKMGQDLFRRKVIGFIAAIILSTCVWYVLRVRSGNLDALFLFFYIATVYTAFLTYRSFKWIMVCMGLFGALVMTKTLAGVSAAVVILWFIFPHLFKSKWNIVYFCAGLGIFCFIVIPWYGYHLSTNTSFYQYHFIHIGARDRSFSLQNYTNLTWELPLFYLHMGVRKWYDPWILSLGIVCMSICIRLVHMIRHIGKRRDLPDWQTLHTELGLIGWNMVVLLPFLTTDRTEIWHLIPVYAPLSLMIAYGAFIALEFCMNLLKKAPIDVVPSIIQKWKIKTALYIAPFLIIASLQIRTFYNEVFPTTKYTVDEVDILRKAKKYEKTVFIDRDYVPIAVFYSEQRVKEQSRYATDSETIQNFIDQSEDAVLVTKNSAVGQYSNNSLLRILEQNNSYSIIEEVNH